ncbi:hypothetical protein [Paraburkholderia youngii]|uniref:hypothetical protein n=1 Tax=Paraburkholderia youngii TaxID=2782701 RepID=UPI0015906CCE|nr:hypothetical protein [Paraburkholderia youngii]NUX59292.1 hypothetical protein [Paraburkholderia youngii]
MNRYAAVDGSPISIGNDIEQLKIEHVLQHDRDVWVVTPDHPFLAIDADLLNQRTSKLTHFPVFSSGQLWQNVRREDLGARLLASLVGGGVNAGFGPESRAFVTGKANGKARTLINWNTPLVIGTTPWCAEGTHVIYVDGNDLFQHEFGTLVTVRAFSRPSSTHFDFTALADLRDRYNADYLNCPKDVEPDLVALGALLDETFKRNALSLAAADIFHSQVSSGMTSVDYEAPVLTKYDRPTHDAAGQPKIEVSFALLHYEKAITEFNELRDLRTSGKLDEAFAHGVYCLVAVAACIEAIANRLVFLESAVHPTHSDKRTHSRPSPAERCPWQRTAARENGRKLNQCGGPYPNANCQRPYGSRESALVQGTSKVPIHVTFSFVTIGAAM